MSFAGRLLRRAYAAERFPPTMRWTMTAAGLRDWFQILRTRLRPNLGDDTAATLEALAAETLRRRYAALRDGGATHLPDPDDDPRATPLLMSALYMLPLAKRRRWIVARLGGGPRSAWEHTRALALMRPLSHEQRWRELTVHLGELLIVLTERLPATLPRARQHVAKICFEMGVAYAEHMARQFELPTDTPVANAIEVLRTSEYLFRVNPSHESAADEETRAGYIDGNACPWYPRPGWNPVHCGIFGQFQAGVCSVFDLRYSLTTTIPKHGGDHCRVDLAPVKLRIPRRQ